jgi:Yip1 domain
MTPPQPIPPDAAPGMSEPSRIIDVYLDPQKAFADIAARPSRWFVPIILLVVAALVFVYAYTTRVGWERYIRQSMESNASFQSLPSEQQDQRIQTGAKIAPIFGYAGSAVGIPVAALVIAGALLVMCKMMGASLNYKQMLAISSYGMLPGLISSILAIIVMFLKNPEDFNLQNPLAFNLGAFMAPPPTTSKALYGLATSMDLFSFWTILLLATGISVAARKFTFSKALVAVIVPWVLYVLAKAGWALAFG